MHVGIHACICHRVHVQVQRQLVGVGFFLQSCGSQEEPQVIRFGSLKPSCWPRVLFYKGIKPIHQGSTSWFNYLLNYLETPSTMGTGYQHTSGRRGWTLIVSLQPRCSRKFAVWMTENIFWAKSTGSC